MNTIQVLSSGEATAILFSGFLCGVGVTLGLIQLYKFLRERAEEYRSRGAFWIDEDGDK